MHHALVHQKLVRLCHFWSISRVELYLPGASVRSQNERSDREKVNRSPQPIKAYLLPFSSGCCSCGGSGAWRTWSEPQLNHLGSGKADWHLYTSSSMTGCPWLTVTGVEAFTTTTCCGWLVLAWALLVLAWLLRAVVWPYFSWIARCRFRANRSEKPISQMSHLQGRLAVRTEDYVTFVSISVFASYLMVIYSEGTMPIGFARRFAWYSLHSASQHTG